MEKLLGIIGGSGFVGKHLIKSILHRDDIKIRLLTREPAHYKYQSDKIEVIAGDLLELASLEKFIGKSNVVVNLAYLTNKASEENLLAAKNLAQVCKTRESMHLIHLSTAVVAGKTKSNIITSDTVCYPCNEYETTKLAIENILIEQLKGKCLLSILRPTAIFGKHGLNLIKTIDELKKGSYWLNILRASLYGRRRMNLVAVENVIAAILFLVDRAASGIECYIVSDDEDEQNNYLDVARIISEYFKLAPVYRLRLPASSAIFSLLLRIKYGTNIPLSRVYSMDKLIRLGFKKPITFTQALLNYLSEEVV